MAWCCARALGLIGLAGLLSVGLAKASFGAAPAREAQPGQYATLVFALEGNGVYTYEVIAPPRWRPLTPKGVVELAGSGMISVTLQVPELVLAAQTFKVTVRVMQDGQEVATATGSVQIVAKAAVDVQAPAELAGELGQPLRYQFYVVNQGNVRDTFTIMTPESVWDVHVHPTQFTLEPGESQVVEVTVVPTTQSSSGYRFTVSHEVRSKHDATVVVNRQVRTIFYDAQQRMGATTAASNPQLTLQLGTGVGVGLNVNEGKVTPSLEYRVSPSLSGQLSDYVATSVGTDALSGSLDGLLPNMPSNVSIGLQAEGWDAQATIGPGRYGLATGFELDDWRLGVSSQIAPSDDGLGFAFGASAISKIPGLDLQFSARTSGQGSGRTDGFGVRYSTPLAEGLTLQAGLDLAGTTSSEQPYRIVPVLSQNLNWQNQDFDVTQTFTTAPTAGLHSLGLAGGTRNIFPFGVRARTNLGFSRQQTEWRNVVTLYSRPLPNLNVNLTGQYNTSTSAQTGSTWSVSPSFSWGFRAGNLLSGSLSGSYSHTGVIWGDQPTTNQFRAGLRLSYAPLSFETRAQYRTTGATTERQAGVTFETGAQLKYAIGSRAQLEGEYVYTWALEGAVDSTSHVFGASWRHSWSNVLATQLQYGRRLSFREGDRASNLERLSFRLTQRNVLLEGVSLTAGYALSSQTSLLDFRGSYTHDVSVALGYTFIIPFDTPSGLSDLFGGRKGGEVQGVAFIDHNLNGIRDADEPVLAGVTVRLGSETTTTDEQGRFTLRVPEGTHELALHGLPATVEYFGDASVVVAVNSTQVRDLALAPVVTLHVELFDDLNHNGVRDGGEPGIAYGGVRLEGPITRVVRMDGNGRAIVSGLVVGAYNVFPDGEFLPSGYHSTTEVARITLQEGQRPPVVTVGAAFPPREVVTTFTTNTLAVIGRAVNAIAPPGADIWLEAMVQGNPDAVFVQLGNDRIPLQVDQGRQNGWTGTVRLPLDAPLGLFRFFITAESSDQQAQQEVFLTVVQQPLFTASAVTAYAGDSAKIEVKTLFKAETGWVILPNHDMLPLVSEDGYSWQGTWQTPEQAGEFEAQLRFDGRDLGTIRLVASLPTTASAGP
jgi:hypothetical protein